MENYPHPPVGETPTPPFKGALSFGPRPAFNLQHHKGGGLRPLREKAGRLQKVCGHTQGSASCGYRSSPPSGNRIPGSERKRPEAARESERRGVRHRVNADLSFCAERAEILPVSVFGVLGYTGGREVAAYPAKLKDLGGVCQEVRIATTWDRKEQSSCSGVLADASGGSGAAGGRCARSPWILPG